MKIKCILKHSYQICDFIKGRYFLWSIYYCENCRKIKIIETPKDLNGMACLEYEKKKRASN